MSTSAGRTARRLACAIGIIAVVVLSSGCTRESLRIALESQRRADQVQQHIFESQHDALRILLYRDLVRQFETRSGALNDAQRAALSDAWNQRDLIEFWSIQNERAKALRTIGVDAKLYSDQSIVDLLFKSISTRVQRAKEALAAGAGAGVKR